MSENELIKTDVLIIDEGKDTQVKETVQQVGFEAVELSTNDITIAEEIQKIEIQETVDTIEADEAEVFMVNVDEVIVSLEGNSEQFNHALLNNRELPNQHPIIAIEGLRQELDKIQSLQTIYSNQKQQADYYLWRNDETHLLPANPYGLFVSIYPDTNKIQICDGTSDVFGVTVTNAAFVGNQEYTQAEGGIKTGRDGTYCLVSHSGIVEVRRETTVVVGDYVTPNSRGEAKKSNGAYGYLVVALSEINGVQYAIISLNAPSTLAKTTADSVQDLSERMSTAEYNITSVTNVANSAYVLAKDAQESADNNSKYTEDKITEAFDKIGAIDKEVGSLTESVVGACENAKWAQVTAESAVSFAQQMGDNVYKSANEAIGAIKDIGAGSTSWAKRVVAYSIGEYSQAYGLTLEQAKIALTEGVIYIPTIVCTEVYDDLYSQEFSLGYYYQWDGEKWVPSLSTAVNFSSTYISGSTQTPYWIVTEADVECNGVVYKLGCLYKWEDGAWTYTGANVEENTLSRAVSAIHQTANELSMEVTDIIGNMAGLKVSVDENSADIQTVTQWTKGQTAEGETLYNIATIQQTANEEGSSLALVVADTEGNKVLNGASIVVEKNEDKSYITVDADQIVMTGTTTFLKPDDVGEGGSTVISGSRITTGKLDAEKVKVINLQASSIIVTGNKTVNDALSDSLVSSTIYYALSTNTKIPPEDDSWSEEAPEKERKKYMWQKIVNVYGDGSSEEKVVCIAGADGESPIVVDVVSSTGNIYINNDISTTLTAKVYQDNEDITNEFPDGAFLWVKYDRYGVKDTVWSYTGKTVAVNNLDIYKRAMFNCILDVEQRL